MPKTSTAARGGAADVDAIAASLRGLCDEIRRPAGVDRPSNGDPSVANMRAYLALRAR